MKRAYKMSARAEGVEQTRRRIIEAATELFAERPYDLVSLAEVAKRSGISLATVVRQFETKERLFAVAIAAGEHVIDGLLAHTPENDPAGAVHTFVEAYERYGDVLIRLTAQEERVPAVRAMIEHGRSGHRAWIDRVFAKSLSRLAGPARKRRTAQLMAVTDVQVWRLLRRELGLTRGETENALLELIEGLRR